MDHPKVRTVTGAVMPSVSKALLQHLQSTGVLVEEGAVGRPRLSRRRPKSWRRRRRLNRRRRRLPTRKLVRPSEGVGTGGGPSLVAAGDRKGLRLDE